MRSLKILTWHVHGSYLLYLTRFSPHTFYLPTDETGNGGRGTSIPFSDNVREIPLEDVKREKFDCILFQHHRNYFEDQHRILSDEQKRLPRIFLEHDPPVDHPTEQRHLVADEPEILLVHVTPFNALMWESGAAITRTIDHGVFLMQDVRATLEIERGVTAVNNLFRRLRRVGKDVWTTARDAGLPLDLVGMNAELAGVGGVGEIAPPELPEYYSRYRFYFNPSLYTSLNLAVIEAMIVGLPIVGLATTEMSTVVQNGVSGFVDTRIDTLVLRGKELLQNKKLAERMGAAARAYAAERFSIRRFTDDWNQAFAFITT